MVEGKKHEEGRPGGADPLFFAKRNRQPWSLALLRSTVRGLFTDYESITGWLELTYCRCIQSCTAYAMEYSAGDDHMAGIARMIGIGGIWL